LQERELFKFLSRTLCWIGEHFKGLLFLLIVLAFLIPKQEGINHLANVEEIKLFGAIIDAQDIVSQLEEAKHNPHIQGVLLNVNSPGGSVPPSIEISYAVASLAKEKPVVVYASGILASGSYYGSIFATHIVANPGAVVGSIGVIMESVNLHALLDKIGISSQVVKEGRYKEAGTLMRQWTPQEREELTQLTKDTYALFTQDVAKARGLSLQEVDQWANAHIFSAKRAKERGLIDEVGVKRTAINWLQQTLKLKRLIWKKEDPHQTLIEKIKKELGLKVEVGGYRLKASL